MIPIGHALAVQLVGGPQEGEQELALPLVGDGEGLPPRGHVADVADHRPELALELAGPRETQVVPDGGLHVGGLEFPPVGILGQGPRPPGLPGSRGHLEARRQHHADPIDDLMPGASRGRRDRPRDAARGRPG